MNIDDRDLTWYLDRIPCQDRKLRPAERLEISLEMHKNPLWKVINPGEAEYSLESVLEGLRNMKSSFRKKVSQKEQVLGSNGLSYFPTKKYLRFSRK